MFLTKVLTYFDVVGCGQSIYRKRNVIRETNGLGNFFFFLIIFSPKIYALKILFLVSVTRRRSYSFRL